MLSAFLMGSRTRLHSLIALFRLQSLLMAATLVAAVVLLNQPDLLPMAILIFALKVVLIPVLLTRVARKTNISGRLPTFLRPTTMSFVAALAVGLACFLALRFPFEGKTFLVCAALMLLLIGFELLIVHKNLFGQGIGFLVLENGISFLSFALGSGMPFFVEIGVLFDLLALMVLATALIARAHLLHHSVATEYMETLKDL
jgi:hydrogenase-4 component E